MRWEFETIKIGLSFVFGVIVKLLGGYDPILHLLVLLIIADVVTGFAGGIANKKLNSEIMLRGSIKKMIVFIVIIIAVQIDIAFEGVSPVPMREIVVIYFITQEGISFIENVSKFISLPSGFTKFFEKIGGKENENY